MPKTNSARARLPRGTKPVIQAFFEALDAIPESLRADVALHRYRPPECLDYLGFAGESQFPDRLSFSQVAFLARLSVGKSEPEKESLGVPLASHGFE